MRTAGAPLRAISLHFRFEMSSINEARRIDSQANRVIPVERSQPQPVIGQLAREHAIRETLMDLIGFRWLARWYKFRQTG